MATRGSPKPLLRVRVLLPLPTKLGSLNKSDCLFLCIYPMTASISESPSPYKWVYIFIVTEGSACPRIIDRILIFHLYRKDLWQKYGEVCAILCMCLSCWHPCLMEIYPPWCFHCRYILQQNGASFHLLSGRKLHFFLSGLCLLRKKQPTGCAGGIWNSGCV